MSWCMRVCTVGLIALSLPMSSRAEVKLPAIFSDRMVLQRDRPIPVWGWASAGETVTVTLGENTVATKADPAGKWRVDTPAMKAGGPHKLIVAGTNTITVQDILIGEVWVCIGQSNMQLTLSQTEFAGRDIGKSADPQFRLCSLNGLVVSHPITEAPANWAVAGPGSVAKFSAVAYYFGKELREKLNVPVGIVHWSAGAIPIESWTPAEGCRIVPSQAKVVRIAEQAGADLRKMREAALTQWIDKAKAAIAAESPLPPMPAVNDLMVQRGWMQTGLFNGVINPIIPFGIRGVVMYQGEANNGQGMEYHEKMQALVGGWRKLWGQGDFPFLFVQIAPWAGYPEGNIEGIWEAQRLALASIPNTGMAVTTDLVPNLKDIHPPKKLQIGQRLALWALARTYGDSKLVHSGPLFKSAKMVGDKIRVSFDHVGSGLATRDGKAPDFFQVGTPEGFVDANAAIDGNDIVLWSDKTPSPQYVRFGWKNVAQPNLINKEGLPASPFRTDCPPVKFSAGSKFAGVKRVTLTGDYLPGAIRYTLDGSRPTEASPEYKGPIEIDKTTTVSARFFAADGRSSLPTQAEYSKVDPVKVDGKSLVPGIDFEFYIGRWVSTPDFDAMKPDAVGSLDALKPTYFSDSFMAAHRFRGYLDVPTEGDYTFSTKVHGGAQVFLDGRMIVDDEGFHAPIEKVGPRVTLKAGKHPLVINFHEGGGPPNLSLFYEGPGIPKCEVPASAYYRDDAKSALHR